MVCQFGLVLNTLIKRSIEIILKCFANSEAKTNRRKHCKKTRTDDDVTPEDESQHLSFFDKAVLLFESRCQALSHFCCQSCQMTGITIKQSFNNKFLCTKCQASHTNKENNIKDLPIWYDKNEIPQYYLPEQLQSLREGEKLLIQQVAAYVPLLHLKDGQIGSRGHVCSLHKIYHLFVLFYLDYLIMLNLSRWLKNT